MKRLVSPLILSSLIEYIEIDINSTYFRQMFTINENSALLKKGQVFDDLQVEKTSSIVPDFLKIKCVECFV